MTPEQRRLQIGRIHQAKKMMALNDTDYRNLLDSLTGCDSCAKMTDRQLNHALDWMFYMAGRRHRMPAIWGKYHNDPHANLVRLCYVFKAIVPNGYQKSPLTSMTWQERTCGRCGAFFEELESAELVKLIEGLKVIFARTGVQQTKPATVETAEIDRIPFSNAV